MLVVVDFLLDCFHVNKHDLEEAPNIVLRSSHRFLNERARNEAQGAY